MTNAVYCPVTHQQEQELKARLGRAIKMIPGKSLEFEDNCRLCIAGRKASETIGGLPINININGFRLFDPEHRSSRPLNLAYKAAR